MLNQLRKHLLTKHGVAHARSTMLRERKHGTRAPNAINRVRDLP